MKLLLLSGAKPGISKFGGYSFAGPRLQPYNILQIASLLKLKGIKNIDLIDTEIEKPYIQEILNHIKTSMPDVIGISIYTKSLIYIYELLRNVKERFPGIIIIAGGPHATIAPERLLTENYVDFCVSREGEYAFYELVDALDKGKDTKCIKNLCYLDKKNAVIRNPERPYIEQLDDLPYPEFELIRKNMHMYRPQIMTYKKRPMSILVTSRGCAHSCSFCPSSGIWKGSRWRAHSAGYVVGLIKRIHKDFGIREVCFNENSFALDRQRVIDISKKIIDENIDIMWTANVNMRSLDEELLWYMKRSGCWLLSVGIESGSDIILKDIKKPLAVKEAKQKIFLMHKAGIKVRGYFMLGHLRDTAYTINKTITFGKNLSLFSVNFSVLIPIQGSEIYRDIYGTDHLEGTGESDNYNVLNSRGFEHPGFTMKQLDEFQRRAFKNFFINFRQTLIFIMSINSFEDLRKYTLLSFYILLGTIKKLKEPQTNL
jgi:anaerobic magnesium-protoporphyrin IX monomethyl ester cyclase